MVNLTIACTESTGSLPIFKIPIMKALLNKEVKCYSKGHHYEYPIAGTEWRVSIKILQQLVGKSSERKVFSLI